MRGDGKRTGRSSGERDGNDIMVNLNNIGQLVFASEEIKWRNNGSQRKSNQKLDVADDFKLHELRGRWVEGGHVQPRTGCLYLLHRRNRPSTARVPDLCHVGSQRETESNEVIEMKQTRFAIRQYMLANWEDHLDRRTNEVNMTSLAEDACSHFNDYEGDHINQVYFDLSYEVALKKEKELNEK
jgi:glycerol-3-phosphate dehydrogenase